MGRCLHGDATIMVLCVWSVWCRRVRSGLSSLDHQAVEGAGPRTKERRHVLDRVVGLSVYANHLQLPFAPCTGASLVNQLSIIVVAGRSVLACRRPEGPA